MLLGQSCCKVIHFHNDLTNKVWSYIEIMDGINPLMWPFAQGTKLQSKLCEKCWSIPHAERKLN